MTHMPTTEQPEGTAAVPNTRLISTTAPLTGGGDLSADRTIALLDGGVTMAKLADLATTRLIGRVTAGTGVPEALTGTQATTLLNTFTSVLKGVVPASGGGTSNYLRADGTWTAPPGGGAGIYVDVTASPYSAVATETPDSTTMEATRVAFQAAIDAVQAAGGGTIYVPAGRYTYGRDGVEIYALLVDGCSGITFRGDGPASIMSMGGDAGSYTSDLHGVKITDSAGITFEQLFFSAKHLTNYGEFTHKIQVGTTTTASENIRIINCDFGESAIGNGEPTSFLFSDMTYTADQATNTFTAAIHTLQTGDGPLRTTSATTLPAGLAAATDYYAIRVTRNTFKLATSRVNALAGTEIDITTNGTGVHTLSDYITPLVFADRTFTALASDNGCYFTAHTLESGDGPFRLTTTGVLPAGLALATDYYVITYGDDAVRLAATRADALAATPVIDITDAGTGVHTISDTAGTERVMTNRGRNGGDDIAVLGETGFTQTFVTVQNCYFGRTGRSGLGIQRGAFRVHVISCTFDETGQSIHFEPTSDGDLGNFVVFDNDVIYTGDDGGGELVTLSGFGSLSQNIGSVCSHNRVYGGTIGALNLSQCWIDHNIVYNDRGGSTAGAACIGLFRRVTDVWVTNNWVTRGTDVADAACISATDNNGIAPDGVWIHNNRCEQSKGHPAIELFGVEGASVMNNRLSYHGSVAFSGGSGFFGILALSRTAPISGVFKNNRVWAGLQADGVTPAAEPHTGIYIATDTLLELGQVTVRDNEVDGCHWDYRLVVTPAQLVEGVPQYSGNTSINCTIATLAADGSPWVADAQIQTQRLSADGAASPYLPTTFVSGAGIDLSLANGVHDGFVKRFVVSSGTGVLTPANLANGTTLTWGAVASFELIWDHTATEWRVLGTPNGAVLA
jgi:hypothetical protein